MDDQYWKDHWNDDQIVWNSWVESIEKVFLLLHEVFVVFSFGVDREYWIEGVGDEWDTKSNDYTSREDFNPHQALVSFCNFIEFDLIRLSVSFSWLVKGYHYSYRELNDDKHLLVPNAYLENHWSQVSNHIKRNNYVDTEQIVQNAYNRTGNHQSVEHRQAEHLVLALLVEELVHIVEF